MNVDRDNDYVSSDDAIRTKEACTKQILILYHRSTPVGGTLTVDLPSIAFLPDRQKHSEIFIFTIDVWSIHR